MTSACFKLLFKPFLPDSSGSLVFMTLICALIFPNEPQGPSHNSFIYTKVESLTDGPLFSN